MNKNIKRTIAIALAMGAFSAVGPTKYVSIITTEAYASSSEADELTDLQLETSDGDSIDLYEDSSYDDELEDDPSVGETYYAETSENKVVLNIDGADEDNVRIFKGSTEYEVGDDISISSDTTTTLKVRVYEDEYDEDEDYSSSDYNQYTIAVENTDDDEEDDDINLSNIVVNNGYINFNEDITSYNVNVAQDTSSITVKATPEDDDYTVKINGTTVDDDDYYTKTVTLSTGSNTIKIIVSDDDDNTKTYTLNIDRSAQQTVGQGTNMAGIPNQAGNNGIQNGNNGMKNGNNGIGMKNGNNNGTTNGNQVKGWKQVDQSWYYVDNNGQNKTGWLQDTDSKWYYLQSSGVMAKNTVIDGYKIGADGAWVK